MPLVMVLIVMLSPEVLHGNASRSVALNCVAQGILMAVGAVSLRVYQVVHKMHHAYLNTRLDLELGVLTGPLLFRALSRMLQPIGIGLYAVCYRRDVLCRAVRDNDTSVLASICVAALGAAVRVYVCGWLGLLGYHSSWYLARIPLTRARNESTRFLCERAWRNQRCPRTRPRFTH